MADLPFEMPDDQELADFEADPEFAAEPEQERLSDAAFSPEVHNDVVGMLFLGALTDEFDVFGHRIVLSTLTAGEELSIALVIKDYQDTIAQGKAMAVATIAAALERVDGAEPWPKPLGPSQTFGIREKFQWLKENWHWATIEAVYTRYAELLLRQEEAFRELEGNS